MGRGGSKNGSAGPIEHTARNEMCLLPNESSNTEFCVRYHLNKKKWCLTSDCVMLETEDKVWVYIDGIVEE
jgi:hypothetical protein